MKKKNDPIYNNEMKKGHRTPTVEDSNLSLSQPSDNDASYTWTVPQI